MKSFFYCAFSCLTFLFLIPLTTNGQAIRGKITDFANSPVADAVIYVNSTGSHTHSNQLGHFICQRVNVGDTLEVQYLGFEPVTHIVRTKDFDGPLNFELVGDILELDQVYISNELKDINQITSIDLKTNPVKSSQEVLRKVPGLFIGQHAGGGKAEQIFLRGFDIDHGTDIAINVDGIPVNMVSHAHGQGYADLHFLIPETIDKIDFGKGPFYTDQGNFNTAGYVSFKTKDRLDHSSIGLELGQFNTKRLMGMMNLVENSDSHQAYLATEYITSDGPFESPQNFNRLNVMGKYSLNLANEDRLSILLSHFNSQWDASGQIPQRLVDQGIITRFGAVDDTEGGQTSRTNIALSHTKNLNSKSFIKTQAFYSSYDFELFSNFTFFLEDPDFGDQIRQHEQRDIFGIQSSIFQQTLANVEMEYGIGLRYDRVRENRLSHTLNRKTRLNDLAYGNVNESNLFGYINSEIQFGRWLINPGVRLDYFQFGYQDNLSVGYLNQQIEKNRISPKLNIMYNPNRSMQLFIKSGIGFHSNDSRVVVAQNGNKILPAAYGIDFGGIWKPTRRLWLQPTIWYLYSEQEFVYVGDAGIVEPSGASTRRGAELGIRYQLSDEIIFDSDITYTHARSVEGEGDRLIPLAPQWTASGGVSYRNPKGLNAGIRYRFIADRPANEDNSIIAEGYFIADANVSYTFNKRITLGLHVENLFDTDWNEAQFATESRLQNELQSVEELHFTPGTPFFMKASVRYEF